MSDKTFSGGLFESLYGAALDLLIEIAPQLAEQPHVAAHVVLYQCSPFNVRVVGLSSNGQRVADLVVTTPPAAGVPDGIGLFMTEGLNAMGTKERMEVGRLVDEEQADLYVAVTPDPAAVIGCCIRRGGDWAERVELFRLGAAPPAK